VEKGINKQEPRPRRVSNLDIDHLSYFLQFIIPFAKVQPLSGLFSESWCHTFPSVAPGAIETFDHAVVIDSGLLAL
jgi:hypothetical protein